MSDLYNVAVRRYLTSGVAWESEGNNYQMLLFKQGASGPTFNATHTTVAAVLADEDNTECNDASYSREAIAHTNRSITNTARKTQAHIDAAIDFGALDNEEVGGALLFLYIDTTDADNIPIAFLTSTDFPVQTNGAGFEINDGASGLFEAEGVSV